MSLNDVAHRLELLGRPLILSGVSKIELGQRGVDVDDVAALARALDVSPLELIFPLGREPTMEVLPGLVMETWPAAKWFSGEGPPPRKLPEHGWAFERREAVSYFRTQDQLLAQRRELAERRDSDLAAGHTAVAEAAQRIVDGVDDLLRMHRAAMRQAGLDPGNLPSELADLESR